MDMPQRNSGVAASGAMIGRVAVTRLTLTRFRCYEQARLDLADGPGLVVLTGANGAGKTNILEAVSYLSPGRGLRGAAMSDVTRLGADRPWAVAAMVTARDPGGAPEEVRVGTGPAEDGTGRRVVRLDGEPDRGGRALADRWAVNWLTPAMDRLFVEAPAGRRRFLDRMVLGLYPDHGRQVAAYERAMRERNRLLADGRGDPAWLRAVEGRMAAHAVAVAHARLDYAGQLAGVLDTTGDGPFPRAHLALDGWLEERLQDGTPPVEAEDAYRERLSRGRGEDQAAGRARLGVHRTDLVVTHGDKAMPAPLCSTGEQKALLVALVLAGSRMQAQLTGRAPILLLDEVAAHLDSHRRRGLFDQLEALGSQCWLTGTDRALFESLESRARFLTVADATVRNA
ncbi:DNA replication/repair protein RecF [Yunchengibacter salinarum]|uniref:DNA replication/repair protein RecF n=1 Tax=Yunchengibacter salinarum TaxID=3133399 RepID=UPI0035B5D3A5